MGFALADRQTRTAPVAAINTTPLVDVMLVLLIIFMIAAPIFTHRVPFTVPIPVPPDKQAPPPAEQTLSMRPAGTGVVYLLDGQPLAPSALPAVLRQIAGAPQRTRLNLWVDPATGYQQVAAVLALARQSGIEKLGFDDLKAPPNR